MTASIVDPENDTSQNSISYLPISIGVIPEKRSAPPCRPHATAGAQKCLMLEFRRLSGIREVGHLSFLDGSIDGSCVNSKPYNPGRGPLFAQLGCKFALRNAYITGDWATPLRHLLNRQKSAVFHEYKRHTGGARTN